MAAVDESIIDFRVEAQRSLEEVSFAIKHGAVSTSLPSSNGCAYCNITTSEWTQFTIRLCSNGFQVVGRDHDNRSLEEGTNTEPVFETVYALLNHLSPSYQLSFNHAVSDKLAKVNDDSFN